MSLKLSSKTLTGSLHSLNKRACDWGWQGFFAYGCQNLVTVIDPRSVQVIQTLDKHKGYVVKVKWAKENYHHDLASPYTLWLATADYNGKVIVWNVLQGAIMSEFSDGSKPIADIEWLKSQDASQDLLAILHPPYSLVLWNALTGTKLWKKSYTEVLQAFTFDPFDPSRLAFLGQDCILFVDDFSLSKTPSSNGRKYYISSPNSQGGVSNSASSEKVGERKSTTKSTIKIMSSMIVGDSNKSSRGQEDSVAVNDCLQLIYHPGCRHHLIMLYAREILILDLDINQTVGIIQIDKNGSPFMQVMPIRQRDVLMCLHENGSITARLRRKPKEIPPAQTVSDFDELSPQSQGLNYDLRSQSDAMRLTRHVRVYGTGACPVSENRVSVLLSDGRVLLWELTAVDYKMKISPHNSQMAQSPLFTPGDSLPANVAALGDAVARLNLQTAIIIPKTALQDILGPTVAIPATSSIQNMPVDDTIERKARHEVSLKFILKGLLCGVSTAPCVVKMCPPLTTKNWAIYQPLLAIGTGNGSIQIFNVSGGFLTREFSIHTSAVRGIEWCSLQSFMSYTCSSPNSNGLVKNEIVITDIQTGKTTPLRANRDEESPIEMIKISYLKQYFVVVFKDKPFELWELKTGTMMRQMPRHFPKITALEWSPSHGTKGLKKKSTPDSISFSGSSMDLSATTPSGESPSGFGSQKSLVDNATPVKEHFVFTDTEGLLYHFIIEGNMVKDGSKIPPDGSMSQISSLAWKGDTLVLGDIDGNLNIWDLKQRISKAIPTHKGWVKKMKFAPGRGNMKLLVVHNDGADVWEAKNCEMMSSIKTPKDLPKITDADWVASDKPAFACADGCVRILDVALSNGCSSLSEYQLQDPVFSPYILPPKAAQCLKCQLQHQPWNDSYSLCLDEADDNSDICAGVNEQLQLIDGDIKAYLCECPFGTAQRCVTTARLFGDESDLHFWTLALHYLREEKAEPSSKKLPRSQSSSASIGNLFIPTTPAKESSSDLLDLDSPKTSNENRAWKFVKDAPLQTCYDILCDNETFQKHQLERISLHDKKRSTYEHTKKCAENLILLGQADRAVQLLLETDAANDSYYVDSLRACLVASIRSSGASQSTIKLVATNLIANGKLSEGVQLLCLIEKGLDACRYLQTYGEWNQAAWLAKATLDYPECCEVMRRWADQLNTPQVNQKSVAVLIMLSLGYFGRVIEMLYSLRQFDRAALFIEACKEFQLLPTSDEMSSLVEAVFLEYSRHLLQLGNRKAAEYYCKQAGEKGKQLLTEIVAAFSP